MARNNSVTVTADGSDKVIIFDMDQAGAKNPDGSRILGFGAHVTWTGASGSGNITAHEGNDGIPANRSATLDQTGTAISIAGSGASGNAKVNFLAADTASEFYVVIPSGFTAGTFVITTNRNNLKGLEV